MLPMHGGGWRRSGRKIYGPETQSNQNLMTKKELTRNKMDVQLNEKV